MGISSKQARKLLQLQEHLKSAAELKLQLASQHKAALEQAEANALAALNSETPGIAPASFLLRQAQLLRLQIQDLDREVETQRKAALKSSQQAECAGRLMDQGRKQEANKAAESELADVIESALRVQATHKA